MNELEFDYNLRLDILSVDGQDRDYKKSVQVGDFIVDLDEKDRVRGIEIQNISEILELDRKELEKVSEVRLEENQKAVTLKIRIGDSLSTLSAQISNVLA